jgi:hypothetical protein
VRLLRIDASQNLDLEITDLQLEKVLQR